MSRKVFTVMRHCAGRAGSLLTPQVTFGGDDAEATENEAKRGAQRRQADFMVLLDCQVMKITGRDQCEPVGLTVKDILNMIGVENVGHFVHSTEVRESDIDLAPSPKIILAS